MKEITTLHELLGAAAPFASAEAKAWLLPLHSTLGSDAQMKVFERPPKGVTKVVLATNIAETSVTIDDVTLVIDCGRHKQNEYDPRRRMEALVEGFASRANLTQRRGRAGRVAAGVAVHLLTSHRFSQLEAQQAPELHRVPLERGVHRAMRVYPGESAAALLAQLPQPPSPAVKSAVKVLIGLGALEPLSPTPAGAAAAGGSCDDGGSSSSSAGGGGGGGLTERLTALGFHLASLPLDVRIGKLILLGAILQCVDPALTLAAALTCRSPFVAPFGMRAEADEAKKALAVGGSDHLTVVRAYSEWDALSGSARFKFAQEHFLSIKTLQMIAATKRELLEQLHDARFVSLPKGHRGGGGFGGGGGGADDGVRAAVGGAHHSRSTEVLLGLLVGAMWPRVARVDPPPPPRGGGRGRGAARGRGSGDGDGRGGGASGGGKIRVKDDCGVLTAALHPSCISARPGLRSGYLVYSELVQTDVLWIRDASPVAPVALWLFGGRLAFDAKAGLVTLDDGWIRFKVGAETAAAVLQLRQQLDALLAQKVAHPDTDLSRAGAALIDGVTRLMGGGGGGGGGGEEKPSKVLAMYGAER